MWGVSEIKNWDLIENKPYITRSELGVLLDKSGKNLDKKVLSLIKNKYLIPLKKGLYTTTIYKIKSPAGFEEYLANIIYYPSYLSLEYVLSKEGVIPESVYVYTSITSKTTRFFENEIGKFSYRKISDRLFDGFTLKDFESGLKIKIASKSKALFDFFYLKPFENMELEIDDLRINWEVFDLSDLNEFYFWVDVSGSAKMEKIKKIVRSKIL